MGYINQHDYIQPSNLSNALMKLIKCLPEQDVTNIFATAPLGMYFEVFRHEIPVTLRGWAK